MPHRIEPFLYETLMIALRALPIPPPSILLPFKSKPAIFFQKNVRNLFLDDGGWPAVEQFNLVLSVCSGVLNLALISGTHPSMLTHIRAMKLQRLTICLQDLFHDLSINLTFSSFATITHLDVLYTAADRLAAAFSSLPALTHLHLYIADLTVLRRALRECRRLTVLIHTCFGPPVPTMLVSPDANDPRIVLMDITRHDMVRDWKTGTHGWRDLWAIADVFVAKRKGLMEPCSWLALPRIDVPDICRML